jgi:hypothetical protein
MSAMCGHVSATNLPTASRALPEQLVNLLQQAGELDRLGIEVVAAGSLAFAGAFLPRQGGERGAEAS